MESPQSDSLSTSKSPYTQTIDLTQKAQREERLERTKGEFPEPEPRLPDATVDTLPERVQQALTAAHWDTLMPVQEKAIPYILDRRDLIVQSRTGTGKTGAFLLPLFELLDPSKDETQALILTPTRELARQIYEEFERMKAGTPEMFELRAVLVYGGVGYGPQIKGLKSGAQVVVGTPGRTLDHLDRRTFTLDTLRVFVLDEADEMLSMGFYPSMMKVKRYLPKKRLSYMFSATMPPKVRQLGQEFLKDPGFLSLSVGQIGADLIEHQAYLVDPMDKDRALVRLIEMENPDAALIFANTKREVEYLAKFLKNYGYHAGEISGDLTQKAREQAMGRLRDGKLRLLVATDVAARGIDIPELSHVFQYDVPQDQESYIHRTGRTARAGRAGTAITLTTIDDRFRLDSIAQRYGIDMDEREVPDAEKVAARVAERMVVVLEDQMRGRSNLERERLQRFVPVAQELAREEPELLAMLVDDLYHEQIHQPPNLEPGAEPSSQEPKRKKPRRRGGKRRR